MLILFSSDALNNPIGTQNNDVEFLSYRLYSEIKHRGNNIMHLIQDKVLDTATTIHGYNLFHVIFFVTLGFGVHDKEHTPLKKIGFKLYIR